jgi:chromosomal replication initiator protein
MPGATRRIAPADTSASLWKATLEALRDRIPKAHLEALTDGPIYLQLSESELRLALPVEQMRTWLRQGTLRALCDVVTMLSDGSCDVCVLPVDDKCPALEVDPSHKLDSFLRSSANEGAWKVARQIVAGVLPPPGPIVFCGPEGSGKSHLLDGMARELCERGERVVCQSAGRLSLELIEALWSDQVERFRERVTGCDALLLDSIETLAGRDGTQNELVRAILARSSRGKLVVLAIRSHGGSLPPLAAGLQGAFERGTLVDLASPEWELRVAIVIRRAGGWGVRLAPDAASFVVGRLGSSLTGVDALLTRLMTHTHEGADLSVAAVRRALAPPPAPAERVLPVSTVLSCVARHFGLRIRDLHSTSRSPRIATPRQIAMYLVRGHCGLSFPEIGQRFGRHHTTVMHACRRVENLLEGSGSVAAAIRLLEKEVERQQTEGV